jgi:subtilisin family serine protease
MGRTLRRLSSAVAWGGLACLIAASAAAAQVAQPVPQAPSTGSLISSPQPDFVPGELIVRFEPGTAASERSALNAAQGADVRRGLLLPRGYLLRLPKDRDVRAAVRAYERNPNVQYAEPNYIDQLQATPNDPGFPLTWGLHNTGQTVQGIAGTPDADIDAPEAWDLTTGSSAVTVGIADTGIAYDHPDLAGNIWLNPGESGGGKETNLVDDDGNGKVDDFRGWDFAENDNDPMDDASHGSHVAGTVGGVGNNFAGVAGVNWTVRLAALRICGPNPLQGGCNHANQADAFTYAAQKGMKVVNGSFGGSVFGQVVADAIANAPNTLFVFAAGNGGSDGVGDNNDTTPEYPCQYPSPNIICVAASDQDDNRPGFSNYGPAGVDLAAPGRNIISTGPSVVRFLENFEVANFNTVWTTGGTNNTWARICPPGNCVMTDSPAGNYMDNTDSFARTTGSFNLSGMTDCRAQYLMILDTEFSNDAIYIEGSTDGTTWNFVQGWTGSTGGNFMWFNENLSAYNGQANVYLRYRMVTNGSVTADGAYIDEVAVRCRRNDYSGGAGYQVFDGTSMASPHVAGAAALAFAKEPGARVLAVKDSILEGVDKKPSLTGVVATGGRLNLFGMLTDLAGGHVRPLAASPTQVSLVPAYTQCTSPNRVHGPPDLPGGTNPDGSCNPPAAVSGQATMGTSDANTANPTFVGSVKYSVTVGIPGAPDDSDVKLTTSLKDVRCRPTGARCGVANAAGPADYTGELRATVNVRMTDRWNATAPGGGPDSGTVQDQAIGRSFACAQTASTATGSLCTLSTTVNALAPGLVKDTKRANWQLGQVQVFDGGADGDADTAPGNTLYAVQGLFVP